MQHEQFSFKLDCIISKTETEWFNFSFVKLDIKKYLHETELSETQIHFLPAGGALSLKSAVNKAALHLWTSGPSEKLVFLKYYSLNNFVCNCVCRQTADL